MNRETPRTSRALARRRRTLLLLTVLAALAAGCGQKTTAHRELTERQRDSTLGRSVLPGASAVTRALQVSDQASNAAAKMDSQVEEAPH